ncbi:MAG: flagellar export protein FliJ [Eubacteriales bacterium]
MAKFKFSLQAVERYREIVLDDKKNEYAIASMNVLKQEETIASVKAKIEDTNLELKLKNEEGISALELQSYATYLKKLSHSLEEEEDKLTGLKKIEEMHRIEMVAAKTDSMSIEKIKEKRIFEHLKAEQKKEELFVEEFVSNKLSGHRNNSML